MERAEDASKHDHESQTAKPGNSQKTDSLGPKI